MQTPMASLTIQIDDTPNPNAMKFTLNRVVNPGPTRSYLRPDAATDDALATALFAVGPIASVMIVNDFVTVNKKPSGRWKQLIPKLEAVLHDQLGGG